MSAIVPWNDPGEPPCCCFDPCTIISDLNNLPGAFGQGQWFEVTPAQYVALYAAGTWTIFGSTDYALDATRADNNESWTGTSVGAGDVIISTGQGCAIANVTTIFGGSGFYQSTQGGSGVWSYASTAFRRRLGTKDGKFYVTLVDTRLASFNAVGVGVFSFFNLPPRTDYIITGTNPNNVYQVSYSNSASISVSGNEIASIVLQTRDGGPSVLQSIPPLSSWLESGSTQYSLNFTPSAP
jgi:hypothetical protein